MPLIRPEQSMTTDEDFIGITPEYLKKEQHMLVVHQGLGNLHFVCNECGKKFYKYMVKSEKEQLKENLKST